MGQHNLQFNVIYYYTYIIIISLLHIKYAINYNMSGHCCIIIDASHGNGVFV